MLKMKGLASKSQEKLTVDCQTERLIEEITHFHGTPQLTFTCSKATIETLASLWCFYC